jgi:uncharacterized protein (DUF952 family)
VSRVYKIIARSAWEEAQRHGRLEGSPLDLQDGYIHLSTAAQAGETARLHFKGQTDLVLVTLDAEALGPALRFEPSRGGALFPHLYRPLACAEALEIRPLPLNAEGWPDPGPLAP